MQKGNWKEKDEEEKREGEGAEELAQFHALVAHGGRRAQTQVALWPLHANQGMDAPCGCVDAHTHIIHKYTIKIFLNEIRKNDLNVNEAIEVACYLPLWFETLRKRSDDMLWMLGVNFKSLLWTWTISLLCQRLWKETLTYLVS